MLIFMAVGTVLGLFISRYDHGPRLYSRTQYILFCQPGPTVDVCWPDEKQAWEKSVTETLTSAVLARKALARLEQPDLRESDFRITASAEAGPKPDVLIITLKTPDLRHLAPSFMDALVNEYVAFRVMCFQNAGMTGERAEAQFKVVSIEGNEVYESPPVDPLGPVYGALAGFVFFVIFQVVRGDY